MGCMSSVSGCLVILVNVIFLILGVALGVIGGLIKWGASLFKQHITDFIQGNMKNVASAGDMQKFIDNVFAFLGSYGVAILIIGIILVCLSIFAMCGVCCKSKCMLGTYAFIIGLIGAGVIVLTILLFVKPDMISNAAKDGLTQFIKQNYKGAKDTNSLFKDLSGVVDLVQVNSKCCGVTNSSIYDQFSWNKKFTSEVKGLNITVNLTIPVSCCKFSGTTIQDKTCLVSPNATNSNMKMGCFTKVWQTLDSNWKYVKYAHIGMSAFMLLIFILTICAMRFDNEKIDPI